LKAGLINTANIVAFSDDLVEQLEPFRAKPGAETAYTREVPIGPAQACSPSGLDRVESRPEYDRDCRCDGPGAAGRRPIGDDQRNLSTDAGLCSARCCSVTGRAPVRLYRDDVGRMKISRT
jgi:hypothetical protein